MRVRLNAGMNIDTMISCHVHHLLLILTKRYSENLDITLYEK